MRKPSDLSFEQYWDYWKQRAILRNMPNICESNIRYLQDREDTSVQDKLVIEKDRASHMVEIHSDDSDYELTLLEKGAFVPGVSTGRIFSRY